MDRSQTDDKAKLKPSSFQPKISPGLGEKEKETSGLGKEILEEVGKEAAPEKELEKYVQVRRETIEIPPDIQKLGVRQTGPAVPIPTTPTITLPLSDDQIVSGLHVQITSALRWLAEFCLRQLKKAHIHLKKVKGKIVRVKD